MCKYQGRTHCHSAGYMAAQFHHWSPVSRLPPKGIPHGEMMKGAELAHCEELTSESLASSLLCRLGEN
jgi:hypothetical protein